MPDTPRQLPEGDMADRIDRDHALFRALMIGFVGQVAGRLLDLQWHLTHSEFETATDQLRAHWLIWITSLFVIGVSIAALPQTSTRVERRGYLVVLLSNVAYMLVGVIHFIQHVNHQEVDWSHLLLAITNAVAVIGVLLVVGARWRKKTSPATLS
jgi:hypothetical protein